MSKTFMQYENGVVLCYEDLGKNDKQGLLEQGGYTEVSESEYLDYVEKHRLSEENNTKAAEEKAAKEEAEAQAKADEVAAGVAESIDAQRQMEEASKQSLLGKPVGFKVETSSSTVGKKGRNLPSKTSVKVINGPLVDISGTPDAS